MVKFFLYESRRYIPKNTMPFYEVLRYFCWFGYMNSHLFSISLSMILKQPSVKEGGVKIPWPGCLEPQYLS